MQFATWVSGLILLSHSNRKSPPFVVFDICSIVTSAMRHYLSENVAIQLLCAFVLSRLDYCSLLLVGYPKYLLSKLSKVQNNAARLIFKTTRSAHVTPMLHSLHWLLWSRGSNASCLCFALRSFLIRLSSTFHNFFTYTLLFGNAALLQKPECLVCHPSEQSPVASALSLTMLELSGTSSLFFPSFSLCQFFQIFLENLFLLKDIFFGTKERAVVKACVQEAKRRFYCEKIDSSSSCRQLFAVSSELLGKSSTAPLPSDIPHSDPVSYTHLTLPTRSTV